MWGGLGQAVHLDPQGLSWGGWPTDPFLSWLLRARGHSLSACLFTAWSSQDSHSAYRAASVPPEPSKSKHPKGPGRGCKASHPPVEQTSKASPESGRGGIDCTSSWRNGLLMQGREEWMAVIWTTSSHTYWSHFNVLLYFPILNV